MTVLHSTDTSLHLKKILERCVTQSQVVFFDIIHDCGDHNIDTFSDILTKMCNICNYEVLCNKKYDYEKHSTDIFLQLKKVLEICVTESQVVFFLTKYMTVLITILTLSLTFLQRCVTYVTMILL